MLRASVGLAMVSGFLEEPAKVAVVRQTFSCRCANCKTEWTISALRPDTELSDGIVPYKYCTMCKPKDLK